MVSFFGLRFGSDKKKLQEKQQEAEKSAKKWKKGAGKSIDSDLSFGTTFPPPQRPSSRPGSSNSNRSTRLFRAPFANAEATSSMVDLAPPSARRPSVASLRQVASNSHLKGGRAHISGPLGPPVSLPLGAEPGSPIRPGTAGSTKKEWVNPLDVHFGKDMPSARPHTSGGPSAAKSPLNQFDFDIGAKPKHGSFSTAASNEIGPNGYPSPPPSEKSLDQPLTRVSTEPKLGQVSKPPAPSSLRRVNTAEPMGLPSPAASVERLDAPVVRNVLAKRETMTFHSPRRRSFNRQVDDGVSNVTKREQPKRSDKEREEIKKRRQTEGFEGNFSAFNFGGPPPIDTSMPLPTPSDSPISPFSRSDRPESPAEPKRSSPLTTNEKKTAGERGMSVPMTADDLDDEAVGYELTTSRSTPGKIYHPIESNESIRDDTTSLSNFQHSQNTPSIDSLSHPARPRMDSDTRCPGTPTALQASPPLSDGNITRSLNYASPKSSFKLEEAPPPKINPDRRPSSPLASRPQMEGDFPVTKGLPRGRRRAESPSSQRGRSPERFDEAPPPKLNPDRRSQSPLSSRQPIAGDFPVSKGLPRGRRPGPGSPPITPVSVYGNVPPPRPPRESEGVTTLPGWADRSEKHMSAMVAPLLPTNTSEADSSDHWSISNPASGAPSLAPPRLPSPTFSSLEESLGEDLTKTFELELNSSPPPSHSRPMISPVLSEFGMRRGDGRDSPLRTEAKKAPPRPAPVTLPPSSSGTPTGSIKSPTNGEFSPSFI